MSVLSNIISTKVAGERRRGFTSAMVAGWTHGVVAPSYINQPKQLEDSTGVASEGVGTL